jgi:hypothetical protein
MKKLGFLLLFTVILISCSPTEVQVQEAIEKTNNVASTQTASFSSPTSTITTTSTITFTPTITNTPEPTNTPKPTNTPRPSRTPTPKPEPITISGNSDDVVDVDKWDGPAIAKITFQGTGNFAVINYGANNQRYDLLVNTIGVYSGTVPIDFLDDEDTKRFEVKANGPWEITILEITEMRSEKIPGTFSGSGDDVVLLDGDNPDLLIVDGSSAESNFAIWAYGNRRNLVVNEIAPYTGTALLDNDVFILVIHEGGGEWSLEVTTQ